jgi:broad specificity phosphatase PhoE
VTRLLLLRHGQSTWNAEGRWQGWADAPLSPLGEQQAADAAAHLAGLGLAKVHSSTLSRARRTAEIIAGALGLGAVEVDPDLRERNVGPFAGRTMDDIRSTWPECFDPESGRLLRVPDGEDDEALWARALPALRRIGGGGTGDPVLVVSHGGVIRSIERHLGVGPPPSTPNLGGRWFVVDGDQLTAAEPYFPVEPSLATSPGTE